MKAIVVEERLMQLFEQLPGTPKYHFGDVKEANAFIKGRDGAVYPLIYQVSNRWRQNPKEDWVESDLVFILAVRNTTVMYNTERWATSYRNELMPLYNNIVYLFQRSNIVTSALDFEVINHPNYSETESKDKNAFIDIVDALEVRVTLQLNKDCIKTILWD